MDNVLNNTKYRVRRPVDSKMLVAEYHRNWMKPWEWTQISRHYLYCMAERACRQHAEKQYIEETRIKNPEQIVDLGLGRDLLFPD